MKRLPLWPALAAAGACLVWMALTVHFNYGGNWTALFCTGALLRQPPQLAAEDIYLFPDSTGYDGQYYHYQAHDPFFRKGLSQFVDSPLLRYRRMLVPTAAWLLAFGNDHWVDPAFFAIILLSVFLGVYWSSRLAEGLGRSPYWGFLFLLVPATPIAVDRMVVDVTLTALVAGFVWHCRGGFSWKTFLILALAALARETGLLLAAACALFWLVRRKWIPAALSLAALLPLLPWYAFVSRNAPPAIMLGAAESAKFRSPLVWLRPVHYGLPPGLQLTLHLLDYALLAGVALALVLALCGFLRGPRTPRHYAGVAFAGLIAVFFFTFGTGDAFALPRISSPLLLLVAMQGSRLGLAPLLLAAPRILIQHAPQIVGILRGLF